ncbi:MAG: DUF1254 domain-containing protein [Proteobacteria bacterium]|nr:DUF1254 domain-containing protein [Pseudomonadota bacterium]
MSSPATADQLEAIAEEAYIWAFPMLMGYRYGYATFLQPASPVYAGPPNHGPYGEAVTLDHTFKDVITPNADTPYSFGLLDLRAGPIVLSVPEITDRYYVMQFEDLVGYNELFIGSRATGSDAGTYLLIGPQWSGDIPEGFTSSFRFETDLVFLIGRTQLLSPKDQPALAHIMSRYKLEPLEVHQGGEPPTLDPFDWPAWDDEASRDERFIGYVNPLLTLTEPLHPDDLAMFARFAEAGIGHGLPLDTETLDADTRQALRRGVASARARIEGAAKTFGEEVNGWRVMSPFGNREFYGDDYLKRAASAMVGWGGNDQIEANYPMARVDIDGNPLDGGGIYQMTMETPVNAFWSVTMYDTSYDGVAGYMVENSIDRYLINSTTQGLVTDDADQLTITMQRNEPTDPVQRANWIPTPEGNFYVTLRMYWPKTEALDGTWNPPPIVRVS